MPTDKTCQIKNSRERKAEVTYTPLVKKLYKEWTKEYDRRTE
jgi:hypothetical protein